VPSLPAWIPFEYAFDRLRARGAGRREHEYRGATLYAAQSRS
jgi:hypothetical protein